MWIEIVKSKRGSHGALFQFEDEECQPYRPKDGDTFRSASGTFRVHHKPEYGDWFGLRVSSGELLIKLKLETT